MMDRTMRTMSRDLTLSLYDGGDDDGLDVENVNDYDGEDDEDKG